MKPKKNTIELDLEFLDSFFGLAAKQSQPIKSLQNLSQTKIRFDEIFLKIVYLPIIFKSFFFYSRYGNFDSSAMHIQHALRATEVQRKYSKKSEEPIEAYLDREEQAMLEAKHKEEEDRLYKQFMEQRESEKSKVLTSVQEEWEVELEKLTAKFEREMGKKRANR